MEIKSEVIKDVCIVGAIFALGAGCGAITGAGVVAGMVWSISSAALGGIVAASGHKAQMNLNIVGIVSIAAGILGGACALKLAGLAITFSAALLLSTTHAAMVLGVVAVIALVFFLIGRVKPNYNSL